MGKQARGDARLVNGVDDTKLTSSRASALEENVQAIKRWEKATLLARSKVEQVSDWIACHRRQWSGSPSSILAGCGAGVG